MTKFNLKTLAVAVALVAAGGQANASIINAQSGNSELMLYAWSDSLARSYTRDLGVQMNDFLYNGALAPLGTTNGGSLSFNPAATPGISAGNVNSLGYTLTLGVDQLMIDWLGNGSALASDVTWGIAASDGTGTGTAIRALTTCSQAGCGTIIGSGLNSLIGNYENPFDALSGAHNLLGTHAPAFSTSNGSAGANNDGSTADAKATFKTNWGNNANYTAVGLLGSKMDFFFVSPSSGIASGKPTVNQYLNTAGNSTWMLNTDSSLVFQAANVSAVPVPAAVWLFGSGLLGMVGIARRRKLA